MCIENSELWNVIAQLEASSNERDTVLEQVRQSICRSEAFLIDKLKQAEEKKNNKQRLNLELTKSDFALQFIRGSVFSDIQDFCKQTIIDAFSYIGEDDDPKKIIQRSIGSVEEATSKHISMILQEQDRGLNINRICADSAISFSFRGFEIIMFTSAFDAVCDSDL